MARSARCSTVHARRGHVHLDTEHDDAKDLALRAVPRDWAASTPTCSWAASSRRTGRTRSTTSRPDRRGRRTDAARPAAGPAGEGRLLGSRGDRRRRRRAGRCRCSRSKAETDANFERCASTSSTTPARSGPRSPATTCAASPTRSRTPRAARARPDGALELQLLYGMAEPVHAALVRGWAPRARVRAGRRAGSRHGLPRAAPAREHVQRELRAPPLRRRPRLDELDRPPAVDEDRLPTSRRPQPIRLADRPGRADAVHQRAACRAPPAPARACRAHRCRRRCRRTARASWRPSLIDGGRSRPTGEIVSVDPGCFDRVVCRSGCGRSRDRRRRVDVAAAAWPAWRATLRGGASRGAVPGRRDPAQRDASSWRRSRCFEAGKPSPRPTPTCARRSTSASTTGARCSASPAGARVGQVARARRNAYSYEPRGVGVVISPWNFPLAIPAGMVTAALVTGNTVIFKPAEQTPGIALRLVEVLHEAGVPPGVLAFLPGVGEDVGATLVEHPTWRSSPSPGRRRSACRSSSAAATVRPGPAAGEAGHRRDGRQERDHRRRRRRPRRGGAGDRAQRLRLRGPEVLGRVARDRRSTPCSTSSSSGWPARPPIVPVGTGLTSCARSAVRSSTPTPTSACSGTESLAHETGDVVARARRRPRRRLVRRARSLVVTDDARVTASRPTRSSGRCSRCCAPDDFDHALALANDTDYALTAGSSRARRHGSPRRRARSGPATSTSTAASPARVVGRQPFGGYGAVRRRLEGRRARLPAAVRRAPRASPRTPCARASRRHPTTARRRLGRDRDAGARSSIGPRKSRAKDVQSRAWGAGAGGSPGRPSSASARRGARPGSARALRRARRRCRSGGAPARPVRRSRCRPRSPADGGRAPAR